MKSSGLNSATVVTPCFNAASFIDDYLDAIACLRTGDFAFVEVIIVDNGSEDDSMNLVAAHLERKPLPDKFLVKHVSYTDVRSSYAARNYGVRCSHGDILFFTDIDCRPRPDWLFAFAGKVEVDNILSGHVEFVSESDGRMEVAASDVDSSLFLRNDNNSMKQTGVTANACISRTAFHSVGPFDEVTSGGDHMFFLRAKQLGLRFEYVRDSVVLHPTRDYLQLKVKLARIAKGYRESGKECSIPKELVKLVLNPFLFRYVKNVIQRGAVGQETCLSAWMCIKLNCYYRYLLLKNRLGVES